MKKCFKIILFMGFLFCFIYMLLNILRLKLDEADTMKIFYEQPQNSIDVLALGSSHVFGSVNPAILWEEYGISAFDLCAAGSNTTVSYYYLKEALKTQKPKVVILGVNIVTDNIEEFGGEVAYMWTGGMKFSKNKINLVRDITTEDSIDVILEFPISHIRLDELGFKDFLPYKGDDYHRGYKGNRIFWGNIADEEIIDNYTDKIGNIPENTKEMLDKIIKLSYEYNFELILYVSPALRSQEEWESINAIEIMAIEKGIKFINCYTNNNLIKIDYALDLNDKEHVNYLGNIKTTKYIGEYLNNEYNLPDHRGDKAYETWDLCLQDYKIAIEDFDISQSAQLVQFIKKINKPYFKTILFFYDINFYNILTKEEKDAFDELGFSKDLLSDNKYLIKEGNKITPANENIILELGRHIIEINEKNHTINYDRNELPLISNGISIVIFDERAKSIITWREYVINLENNTIEEYRNDIVLQEIWNKR